MAELFWFLVQLLFGIAAICFVLLLLAAYTLGKAKSGNDEPYNLINVDRMSGLEFEAFVAKLLQSRGFSVRVTSATGDFGADVVATKAGIKYAIQCKRNAIQNKVSVRAVQEAVAAVPFYDCDKSMVVTSGYFTKQAVQYAGKVGCDLVRRDMLMAWIKDFERARTKARDEELQVALARTDDVERATRDAASRRADAPKARAEELQVALARMDDVERATRDAASRRADAAKARAEELKVELARIDDAELLPYLEKCKMVVLRELAVQLGASRGYSRRKANLVKRVATHIEKQRANY